MWTSIEQAKTDLISAKKGEVHSLYQSNIQFKNDLTTRLALPEFAGVEDVIQLDIDKINQKLEEITTQYPGVETDADSITLSQTDLDGIDAQLPAISKQIRTSLVDSIVVDVNGKSFDGNEISQTRMARAIQSMTDTDTITWKLADNTKVDVTKDELIQALKLSGLKQTEYWSIF